MILNMKNIHTVSSILQPTCSLVAFLSHQRTTACARQQQRLVLCNRFAVSHAPVCDLFNCIVQMENEQDPGLHNVPPLLCIPDYQCYVRRSNYILSCIRLSHSLLLKMDTDQTTMPEVLVRLVTSWKTEHDPGEWPERRRCADVGVTWGGSWSSGHLRSLWISLSPLRRGLPRLTDAGSDHMETSTRTPESEGFPHERTGGEGWDTHSSHKTSSPAHSSLSPGRTYGLSLTLVAPTPNTACNLLSPLFLLKIWGSSRFVIITDSATGAFKELRLREKNKV